MTTPETEAEAEAPEGEVEIHPAGEEHTVSCDADACEVVVPVEVTAEELQSKVFPPPWLPSGWRAEKLVIMKVKPAESRVMPFSSIGGITEMGIMLKERRILLTFCPDCAKGDPKIRWEHAKWG